MPKLDEADIARIVARAHELGPRERLSYIRAACAGDTDALERALLAHELEATPPGDDGDPAWEVDRSGQVLGSWRLVRRLGGGGMSDVYLAERQGEYSQQVAVKLVRPGLVTRADHNRLRSERQILARLNHRNIARLLDGGTTDDGIPYLVMEYVDGEAIDLYCDRHRLPLGERLALFRGVCSAVHAAHQNLVIHRDLKPSNILVTKDRTLKLLDFGIAKLLEVRDAAHTVAVTHADVRLFTPGHASPEQVRGEPITTTTDVYLLGALLYELLTGKRPFNIRSLRLSDIEHTICHETPPLPSAAVDLRSRPEQEREEIESIARARRTTPARLRRELAGDLNNIVMMALRKEPSRRYASADEFAADITRYTTGQPVIARRDTWRYRAGKFLSRHAASVAVSAAFLLLLVAFAVTMTVQAHRIAQERAVAEQERRRSEEVAGFLVDLFKVSDPTEARGEDMTARAILERGAQRIQEELEAQPAERASLMETIGRVYLSLGLANEARPHLEGSLGLRRGLYPGDHPATASSLGALGELELAAGRLEEATALYREALGMNERLFGRHHLATAASLQNLGQLLKVKGEFAAAETELRASLELFSDLLGPDSTRVSSVMNELAQLMERRGDFGGAEDFYRRALAVDRAKLGTDHPQVAHNVHNLAVVLQTQGNLEAAGPLFEESIARLRQVLGDEHPDTLDALGNYGRYLQAYGDLDRAEAVFRQTLALNTKVRGAEHPYVGYDHVNLAFLLYSKGDVPAAEREYREALRIYSGTLPADHVYIASALTGLAQSLVDLGRAAEGYDTAVRAAAIWRTTLPETHAQVANTEAVMGHALAAQNRFAEAEPLLVTARERLIAAVGTSDKRVLRASHWLADLYSRTNRPELAAKLLPAPQSTQ